MNLIGISANVPQEFVNKKNNWGVTWAYIIREGIKNIELQERLMQEKIRPEDISWRTKAREKINAILEAER
jgi:hypothetical protein